MEFGGIRENILEVRVVRVSALFPERIRSEQTLLVDLMQRKGFDGVSNWLLTLHGLSMTRLLVSFESPYPRWLYV